MAHKFNINNKIQYKKFQMTQELNGFIDGLVLSDANICTNKRKSGIVMGNISIAQCLSHKDWLHSIKSFLENNNILCSDVVLKSDGGKRVFQERVVNVQPAYMLYSLQYVNFDKQRIRWYKNGVKIIPDDIDLSPISLAQWFMGDGSISRFESGRPTLEFSTQCFDMNYLNILREKLYGMYHWDFRPSLAKGKYVLRLYKKKDVYDFLHITAPYKVDCFNYKWGGDKRRSPDIHIGEKVT